MIGVLFATFAELVFFETNTTEFFYILVFVVVDLVASSAREFDEIIL